MGHSRELWHILSLFPRGYAAFCSGAHFPHPGRRAPPTCPGNVTGYPPIAVLAALNMRHRTGAGQHIDHSMLEALIATDDHTSEAIDGRADINDSRGYVWDVVGGPLLLAADPRTTWTRLSAHAGLSDPTPVGAPVETKVANRREAMRAWLASFADREALKAELERANLAWADVRDNATLFENASLRDGRAVVQVDDHAGGTRGVVRMPYRFSNAESTARGTAPRRGQHNAEVLADWLGATPAEIATLSGQGALQTGD
jgi:crotonobetainyl-CoA:carnitine CoA-transferase CaiB-like acyl-CoA transferase